jgi:hypothetical protein
MRSIRNYITRFALIPALALSITGCTVGGGQATTPVVPAPTSATIPVPTTEPTKPSDRPEPKPTGTLGAGEAQNETGGSAMIDSVEVLIRESLPPQVSVNVKGNLSDACTTVDQVTTARNGNTFNIEISTKRPVDQMCAQVLTPFEQNIPLDVTGLTKGTYTVNVEGVTTTFEMP